MQPAMDPAALRDAIEQKLRANSVLHRWFGHAPEVFDVQPVPVCRVIVESWLESRKAAWAVRPAREGEGTDVDDSAAPWCVPDDGGTSGNYREQRIDGAVGPVRNVWTVPLEAARFETGNVVIVQAVPHTQTVDDCRKCGSDGTVTCSHCGGAGDRVCPGCGGAGSYIDTHSYSNARGFTETTTSTRTCDLCHRGRVACDECRGAGHPLCPTCGGTHRFVQFVNVEATRHHHRHDAISGTDELPSDLVDLVDVELRRNELRHEFEVLEEGARIDRAVGGALEPRIGAEACSAIDRLLAAVKTDAGARLVHQKLTVTSVTVHRALCGHRDRAKKFYVLGNGEHVFGEADEHIEGL